MAGQGQGGQAGNVRHIPIFIEGRSEPLQPASQPGEPGVVDFKSALRKVEKPGRPGASEVQANAAGSPDLGFRAGLRSVAGGDLHKRAVAESLVPTNNEEEEAEESILEEENKRKSTGSISSLVKMWEPSSPRDASGASAVSPSLASDSDRPGSVVKFEKRVWPPVPSTETEKPMVPVKPTVKPPPTSKPPPPREPSYKPPPKPLASAKPQVCNIYAAPSSVSARGSSTSPRTSSSSSSRPNISASAPATKPKSPSAAETVAERNGGTAEAAKEGGNEEVTSKEEGVGTKEAATKASKELEARLAKLGTNISKADAMAVAEKADGLAAACSLHVDSVPPTGRFHFRSLLTRLDTQTKELRSLNVSRAADTSKLVKDLQSTVKELGTAIQR